MKWDFRSSMNSGGFTAVEVLVGIVIFGILTAGLVNSYNSIRSSYTTARQLNEMYSVLSACPEVDRALEYNSLTSSSNCYPNNTFAAEDSSTGATVTYSPTISVTQTSSLPSGDPLKTVPDSKVVDISLPFIGRHSRSTPLQIRMLITRNGIGQL